MSAAPYRNHAELLVLRTHQAFWSRKRGYGLTAEGKVVEFVASPGENGTRFFGRLMDKTRAAMAQNCCFGVIVKDDQIVREVAEPLEPDEAARLFAKTILGSEGLFESHVGMDATEMQLLLRASRSF